MTRPYRPPNGEYGEHFMSAFCDRCVRDAKYRETDDGADACPIATAAMIYKVTDPEYPKEWIVDDDDKFTETARCTAFEAAS